MYGLYDGKKLSTFDATVSGIIAPEPRGDYGFGWNAIFTPEKTYAQMTDAELKPFSHRAKAIEKLADYLHEQA
jgi:XTP/dITP diphosphohydrolase